MEQKIQTAYEIEKKELYDTAPASIRELFDRKSVRVFENRPIPEDAKKMILYAAAEAPTAGNQQLYTILEITSQELKNKLAVSCDNQPFIASAPLVLLFCTDCRKWQEAYMEAACTPRNPGVGDLLLALEDTAIAAQNAVTAAWSLGIGSCYIGDILEQCELHRELLHLPDYVMASVMVVFGYPTLQQQNRPKPVRFNMKDLVFENTYPTRTGEEIRHAFKGRTTNTDYNLWMEKFCNRKYNSDFSREMTRSVKEYLKQYSD